MKFHIVILLLFVLGVLRASGADKLSKNFYKQRCRQAETLVRDITWGRAQNDSRLGAKLLRVHYHDCFVRGCDASILLDTVGTNAAAEKDARPNLSLLGYEVIDEIKSQLEKVCPGVVSCSDILALAARDAVSFPFKKEMWDVLTGRRDGRTSLSSEVTGNIPGASSNFTTLKDLFAKKGLNVNDLVALSGAHTIGVAHCGPFSRRLYNFTGKGDTDPSLDETYAASLKSQCPNPASAAITVEMDPQSSESFDNDYFTTVKQNKGLFQSDAALITDRAAAKIVDSLLKPKSFFSEFGKSMKNMGAVEVLTGSAGEIRKNCRIVNALFSVLSSTNEILEKVSVKVPGEETYAKEDYTISLGKKLMLKLLYTIYYFTIGVAHCCGPFSRRLYNFTGKGDTNPSLDESYAASLKSQCPNPASVAITVEMDPQSSESFDTDYFTRVKQNKGLFQSDAALITDRAATKIVDLLLIKKSIIYILRLMFSSIIFPIYVMYGPQPY
ncbi:Peroxidase [Heracleum sosnowskyi]|uniref:peroxidase n=1 Tax=Heracleum sosnowskyi TaxID=360622 RepID=A0AAD8N1F9_9APIA|nr:Peroxidase [Heracleum sosnowskyi]